MPKISFQVTSAPTVDGIRFFKIVRVRNSIDYQVGSYLSEKDVRRLIAEGATVTLK